MKAGEFSIPPGPLGCRPDLTGLSCRFEAMPARRGVMLSIIVQAANLDPAAPEATAYRALIENIIRLVEESPDMARPVPEGGPPLVWPPTRFDLEARAGQAPGPRFGPRQLKLLAALHSRFSCCGCASRSDASTLAATSISSSPIRTTANTMTACA